jgi:hypothetical protein
MTAEPTAWIATAEEIAAHHIGSSNRGRFAVDTSIPAPIAARRFGQNP